MDPILSIEFKNEKTGIHNVMYKHKEKFKAGIKVCWVESIRNSKDESHVFSPSATYLTS